MEKGEYAVILFLDIDAAFSSVNISTMVKNLESFGADPKIINWAAEMLYNRTATATLGNETVEKELNRGTPQGGILSFFKLALSE